MTTPAQTQNDWGGTSEYRMVTPWFTHVWPQHSGWKRKLRPASEPSPKRPDGSRPPKGWHHAWGDFILPSSKRVLLDGVGTPTEESGPWSADSLDYLLGQVAPFSQPHLGVDYFPYDTYAKAVTNFLVKLQANKASLGVTLAELRKTAGTVAYTCSALVGAVDRIMAANSRLKRKAVLEILHFGKVKPRRPGESKRRAERRIASEKRVLDQWLTVQFGLKPLLGDINDLGQGLSHLINGSTPRAARLTIRSGSGEDDSIQTYRLNPIWNAYWLFGECSVMSSLNISAVYELPLSAGRTFEEWGLANPAPVLWELTPFSWMVDYLTNTGKWVQSLVPITGAQFIEGSLSYLQRVNGISGLRIDPRPGYTVQSGGHGRLTLTAGRFVRVKMTSAILPAYRPVIREKLNLTRLANVLAVIGKIASKSY